MRRAVLLSLVAAGLVWTSSASAHPLPADCTANGIDITPAESSKLVRQGDVMTFTVGLRNDNAAFGKPCDAENVSVGFRLPGTNARFNPVATPTAIKTGQYYAYPFGLVLLGSLTWTVNTDPNLDFGQAQAVAYNGKLHFTRTDPDMAEITKTLSFEITNPALTIDKTGSIQQGQAPQNVTYTYVVTNTSTTDVPMSQVKVTDDLCASATYTSGDSGDQLLSNGEKWTFTGSTLHQAPGVYTNTAKACAVSAVDNRDVCSPPDTWTVTLTPPPPPPPVPQAGVKPASATQAPCDIASPSGLNVRARELTTIRVKVRNVDAGTEARITLPGGKVVKAKVNAAGTATFKVRPTKSGRATIRMAECGDVARFAVKPARQVQTRRVPRVTG